MNKSLTKYFLPAAMLALAIPAFAGPVTAEKNVTPMAPAPECTWTGFYIGVNAGVTELQSRFTDEDYWWNGATTTYEKPAFIGGGQVGYNYQWKDLVFGIEADFSGLAGADQSHQLHGFYFTEGAEAAEEIAEGYQNYNQKAKVDFMMTLRGRFGISFLDNKALFYATAGGAYAHGKWDVFYGYDHDAFYNVDWRGDDWRWGWVGGFGLEYALDCHWSVRGEGLYTWLGSDTTGLTSPSVATYHYIGRERFEDDLWSYRIGINYKFTGFGGGH